MTNFSMMTAAIDRMTAEDIADGLITCAAIQVISKDKTVYKQNHGIADADKLFRYPTGICSAWHP